MTKSKLLKNEDKIRSVFQKKLNNMKKSYNLLRIKNIKRINQAKIDHLYKEEVKRRNMGLHNQIIKELKSLLGEEKL